MRKKPRVSVVNDKWITIDFLIPRAFAERSAVYVIYIDNKLVYVGESINLYNRMTSYRGNEIKICNGKISTIWGKGFSVYVKAKYPSKYGEEAMIERRLIRRLRPICNRRNI